MVDLLGGRKKPPDGYKVKKDQPNVLTKKMPEVKDAPRDLKMTIFGPGSFLGEDDVIYRFTHSGTLRCITQKGVLLKVMRNPEDFY